MNRRGGGGGITVRKGRAPCCDKTKVKRGPWSPAEDAILVSFIRKHGHPNWRSLPQNAGLLRCGKSCRLRWINYLRPDVKRGNFSPEEEETIIRMHKSIGNKWSIIAAQLPGRTDNEIKNVWNTHLKKKLANHHSQSPHRESSTGSPSSGSTTSSCISNSNSNGDLMMRNFDINNKDDQNNQVVENEEEDEEEEEEKVVVSPSDGDFEFWRWFESLKDCNEEGGEIEGGEGEKEEQNEHDKEEEMEKMGVGEELKQWLKQLENELELF